MFFHTTLDLAPKPLLYKTRKCENLQKELCLYYHLEQCPGYCKYDVDQELIDDIKNNIDEFLSGNTKNVINNLKNKMKIETEALNYEKAAFYRDLINDINQTVLKQDVQN